MTALPAIALLPIVCGVVLIVSRRCSRGFGIMPLKRSD
jgi:hypothetical protein